MNVPLALYQCPAWRLVKLSEFTLKRQCETAQFTELLQSLCMEHIPTALQWTFRVACHSYKSSLLCQWGFQHSVAIRYLSLTISVWQPALHYRVTQSGMSRQVTEGRGPVCGLAHLAHRSCHFEGHIADFAIMRRLLIWVGYADTYVQCTIKESAVYMCVCACSCVVYSSYAHKQVYAVHV